MLRPGGTCIIFETMGTGVDVPTIYDFLQGYYTELEQVYSFSFKTIPLDYHFDTLQEAEQLSRFFFGDNYCKFGDPEVWRSSARIRWGMVENILGENSSIMFV